ncbi:hypothetical protein PENTCL1PPCAC_21958 [Pristionchus entomophagus]|uniref:Peptidase M13 C-terminal domain-containing protein n=1 Tax=Pristionchus entomophagus TaxID=358040 RepID=A0AAV5U0S0_9BILA|nr:hypothetical protein PENTCL1PPCAC_21958 [Pristionchus entomophagus]
MSLHKRLLGRDVSLLVRPFVNCPRQHGEGDPDCDRDSRAPGDTGLAGNRHRFSDHSAQRPKCAVRSASNPLGMACVRCTHRIGRTRPAVHGFTELHQFTENQLFFHNYAQLWCQQKTMLTESYVTNNLLTDPHSLPPYRILGTLQNIPAFRANYNCPLNSTYAPEDHCNDWVPTKMA